ncbi:MAG: hypothetical protein KTR23_02850 [Rhodospirillales bacterium]|nr:hypothetical protein [Rhodospirillales bacterium]
MTTSSSLSGTWIVTQTWKGVPPYKFSMNVAADGKITIDGGFTGVLQQFPNSYLSMAIANFGNKSVTAYLGNIVNNAMGGEMSGTGQSGAVVTGIWTAVHSAALGAPDKAYGVGE